jgi:hypothetical protein
VANPFAEIRQEWPKLKEAPYSFVVLVVVAAGLGLGAEKLLVSEQVSSLHEQITAKDGQLSRYRIALGIDKASQGALVELSNQELKLKAKSTVASLRAFSMDAKKRQESIEKEIAAKKRPKKEADQDLLKAMQSVAGDYDSGLESDALNVDNELKKRLDRAAISHVIRVPFLKGADGSEATGIFRGTFADIFFIDGLADEMADLLPEDGNK